MAKIFISYRREDSRYAVDRIYEALRKRLKKRDIFMDVDDIPKGVDFVDYLSAKVAQCETLVAVIGPQWLNVTNKAGQRRLDDPEDFVRIEIAAALKRGIPVVPVLLDGTPMPTSAQLPEDMRGFERRNAAEVHRRSLKADIDALVNDLGYAGGGLSRRNLVGGGLVAMLAALGVFAWIDPLDVMRYRDVLERDVLIDALMDAGSMSVEEAADLLEDTTEDAETVIVEQIDPPNDSAALDDAAWADAEARATVSAYREYLAGTNNTRHRGRAETALQRHEQAVLRLQTALNAKGFEAGTADGAVGRQTRAAVEAYRQARGFDVASVDLTAVDPAPIQDFSEGVERWTRPSPTVQVSGSMRLSGNANGSGALIRDCADCPEMVVVPSGSFTMGSPASESGRQDDEGPLRTVRIGYKFAVGKYEVTWAEWEACVADGGCSNSGPNGVGGDEGWGKGSRPVINVSWNDTQAYVEWLSRKTGERYRLLSEAEWEYVARAGSSSAYSWGTSIGSNRANCIGCGSRWDNRQTAPVGSFSANAFGLYDLHGNVWEWTEDCYQDSYSSAPSDGSARIVSDCSRRVLRGGSWYSRPWDLSSAERNWRDPSRRNGIFGFRVARTL